MTRTLIILLLTILPAVKAVAIPYVISGIVTDSVTGETLPGALVSADNGQYRTLSDLDGRWLLRIPSGKHAVSVSFIGFSIFVKQVDIIGDQTLDVALRPSNIELQEIVVTARDNTGLSSGSRIDRDAMSHLQPTSFTDLLELLPGNVSQTPDMGRTNSISLRETGNISASGGLSTNPDYAISSLGIPFVIDGTPINNDAGMREVPGVAGSDASTLRSTVNRGVDMRTISTDNIESVEIVRGIPSAEYGNLTSGVVNIKRIRRATPWTARFKADEYSKLFSAGKGFAIGQTDHVLNFDLGYLDSKVDPRNNLENYKRVTASGRGQFRWIRSMYTAVWNLSVDYTGSFDNAKVDPDLNQRKIDEYESRYNRYALGSDVLFTFAGSSWIESAGITASAAFVNDRLIRRKQVTANGTPLAPTTMEEGVHDGKYLLGTYLADFVSDGRPVDIFMKARVAGAVTAGVFTHSYKAGLEWTFAKNYGRGQIYDLDRPLSGGWTTRPRAYRDINALHTLGAFIEDGVTALIGNNKLEAQAGVRMQMLPGLDSRYYLARRPYIDPRINVVWDFPTMILGGLPVRLSIGGGYGLTTRMPTLDYLFPQVHYSDFVQLGYYDINDPYNLSAVNLRTYITDPVNYDLHAARNRKWEVRIGAEWGKNRLSLTYFRENMNSGYRYTPVYEVYTFRRYDTSSIDPSTLSAPPVPDGLPYKDISILDGYDKVTNGTRINKQGIELQVTTARWKPVATALTVSGAWYHTLYSNSQMLFIPVGTVIGNTPVSDNIVGIYDTTDGRINDRFSTNFMFDTQIPKWGLVFTTTFQWTWWIKTQRLREAEMPVAYLSAADGQLHPYTESDASDTILQHLVRRFSDQVFDMMTIPVAMYLNFKATKQIGSYLRISAFVNRILDYMPDYKSNGLVIRRTAEAYFGMEATITI
ncbi:MAG: TonB-dependent receptor [Odoribacter sp.]|nr:TonB-dependent receptor [Odoribacter sp.]